MFVRSFLGVVFILILVTVELSAKQPLAENTLVLSKKQLQKEELGSIRPVHMLGNIYLAGQPQPEDLPLLQRAGIKTVITLRKLDELSWDEAAAVEAQQMKYVEVPFRSPEELTPKVFDELRKVLNSKSRGPTLLHCGSANRVGAIWYAYRILDGKLSPEAALKEAKTVGLRTPAYLEQAQAYVEQHQTLSADEKNKRLIKNP